jgi:ABC-type multidrug transport system ATPase subunit
MEDQNLNRYEKVDNIELGEISPVVIVPEAAIDETAVLDIVRQRGRTESSAESGGNGRSRSLTFTPWSPDVIPTVLTWENLWVKTRTVPIKELIKGVNGSIQGGFWAIMGPSGGGKTTLLSTLSLRLDPSKMSIEGKVHLNGRDYNSKNLKVMSAYVMQDDLLHAELTVEETIRYAARLRLANKCTDDEMEDRIDEVIGMVDVGHTRSVIIGDTRRKGISGGERKRVCVAIELLTRPKLLFLDEPTSGLDSTTALKVIGCLKSLSDSGKCAVICTIHQPQKKIFEMFDNLILMKKGSIVYQGSCQKSINFLEAIGKFCPDDANPADFLIDSISKNEGDEAEAFASNAKLSVPVDLASGYFLGMQSQEFSWSVWWTQFKVLFQRCGQQYLRRTDIIFLNLVATVTIALFFSLGLWFQIGHDQDSVTKRVPSLFFSCVTQGIVASLQCIASFPAERAIILRERAAGSYFVSAYFAAKTVVDVLSQTWGPTLFCIIAYPTVGYQGIARKFFIYWGFMLLDAVAALSLATMVSCICVSIEMSTVVLSVLFEISRLFGGFFTSPEMLHEYPHWKFADALSYLKYGESFLSMFHDVVGH